MLASKKPKLHKTSHINLGGIICLTVAFYLVYFFLVQDIITCTLSSAFSSSDNSKKWHILAIGFVPIYISLLIFGGSIMSIYLGSALQRWLTRFAKNKVKSR
jgi:hypothetical protein